MQLLSAKGRIIYNPTTYDHKDKKESENWVIVETSRDFGLLYRYFLYKQTGTILQSSFWGSHISIVRGEKISPKYKNVFWKKYHNQEVVFSYDPYVMDNGLHWWVLVYSDLLKTLRKELCLSLSAIPPFHMTLGNVNRG